MNQHLAALRLIQPQQQFEYRAFPHARASDKRHLFAIHNLEAQMAEYRMFVVAERHIPKFHKRDIPADCPASDAGMRLLSFLKSKELVHAVNPRDSRLNGLNFHAQVLDRRKDLGDIVDDRNSRACGHAEKGQYTRIA